MFNLKSKTQDVKITEQVEVLLTPSSGGLILYMDKSFIDMRFKSLGIIDGKLTLDIVQEGGKAVRDSKRGHHASVFFSNKQVGVNFGTAHRETATGTFSTDMKMLTIPMPKFTAKKPKNFNKSKMKKMGLSSPVVNVPITESKPKEKYADLIAAKNALNMMIQKYNATPSVGKDGQLVININHKI